MFGVSMLIIEEKQELEKVYQEFDLLLGANVELLWGLNEVEEHFQEVLVSLDDVVTRKDLEEVEQEFQETEEEFDATVEKLRLVTSDDDANSYDSITNEIEDEKKETEEAINEKEEVIENKEQVVTKTASDYETLTRQAVDVMEEVKSQRRKIQDYLKKIEQIKAKEITVYRSNIMEKTLSFAGKVVRRSVEAKLLSTVVPKKMAQVYLATKLVQDAKKLITEDNLVITRKEADASYFDEMKFEQASMKNYEGMVKESLVEVRSLQEEYKKICEGFPDDTLFKENMRKLEKLEDILLQEALDVEEIVSDYSQTMDYNEQKVKTLRE